MVGLDLKPNKLLLVLPTSICPRGPCFSRPSQSNRVNSALLVALFSGWKQVNRFPTYLDLNPVVLLHLTWVCSMEHALGNPQRGGGVSAPFLLCCIIWHPTDRIQMFNPRKGCSSLQHACSLCFMGKGTKQLLKSWEIHGVEGPAPLHNNGLMTRWILGGSHRGFAARGWEGQRAASRRLEGGSFVWLLHSILPRPGEPTQSQVLYLHGRADPVHCWWASPFQKTPSVWVAAHQWKGSPGAHTAWENYERFHWGIF